MKVYLDNAATTPLSPEVLAAMLPYLKEHYGNPSSIHNHGRFAKSAVEKSRKKVAEILNAAPSEIFFTSGGTEANNLAIQRTVEDYKIKHAITSPLEHHAVLHPLEYLKNKGDIEVHFVEINDRGDINQDHLKELLQRYPGSFVSLMHGNNEIGNLNNIEEISAICDFHQAFFHSDTVQTMGHYPIDVKKLKAHYLVGSAHKFNGPKGIGFIYINHTCKINPLNFGGAQERNMRGGTENVYGIIGLSKALEIAHAYMEKDRKYISDLKFYMVERFKQKIPDILFNGRSTDPEKSLYTILNVSLPAVDDNDMLLFNLDINNISASAGSACASGTNIASHVLSAINAHPDRGAVRFSFGKDNQKKEIDYVVNKLSEIYQVNHT